MKSTIKLLARPLTWLLAPALLLGLCAGALAQQQQRTPVLINTPTAQSSDNNINLQTNTGSACSSPSVGNCGSCSITCPTGHAAMCKPGLAVNGQPAASCLTAPECKCQ
jgi:hypothetical protein